jgi:hypothetical protein
LKPSQILQAALKPYAGSYGPMSLSLGIPREAITRAARGARGRPTRADHHLMLCAYLGCDPVTGAMLETPALGPIRFDATLFAMAVKMRRFERKQTAAKAAKVAGLSPTIYSRIANAKPTSFESLLRAARAAGLDPRDYVQPVSHEAATRKPLSNQPNGRAA